MSFKMKGSPMARNFAIGGSPTRKDPKDKSVSEKQTIVDNKNIAESTNAPMQGMSTDADHKKNVKSVKRQNRLETQGMSRSDIQAELKSRKKQGTSRSKKVEVGFLGRVFGGKKKLASKLAHQRNVSDI